MNPPAAHVACEPVVGFEPAGVLPLVLRGRPVRQGMARQGSHRHPGVPGVTCHCPPDRHRPTTPRRASGRSFHNDSITSTPHSAHHRQRPSSSGAAGSLRSNAGRYPVSLFESRCHYDLRGQIVNWEVSDRIPVACNTASATAVPAPQASAHRARPAPFDATPAEPFSRMRSTSLPEVSIATRPGSPSRHHIPVAGRTHA